MKNKALDSKPLSVARVASAFLPTLYGEFELFIYTSNVDGMEHSVLRLGKDNEGSTLARVHSQCLTGDTFMSRRCDCREQLHQSMKLIQERGQGVIVYLNQEGRGIGLGNKIKAYALQEKGHDTVEANHLLGFPDDQRTYEVAACILKDLGIKEIDLLTNNPDKEKQLTNFGIRINKCLSLEILPNASNAEYLKTKKSKLGHRLTMV